MNSLIFDLYKLLYKITNKHFYYHNININNLYYFIETDYNNLELLNYYNYNLLCSNYNLLFNNKLIDFISHIQYNNHELKSYQINNDFFEVLHSNNIYECNNINESLKNQIDPYTFFNKNQLPKINNKYKLYKNLNCSNINEKNNYKYIIKYNSIDNLISLYLLNNKENVYDILIDSKIFNELNIFFLNMQNIENNKMAIVPYINIKKKVINKYKQK